MAEGEKKLNVDSIIQRLLEGMGGFIGVKAFFDSYSSSSSRFKTR